MPFRFEDFELNLARLELRKSGRPVKLERMPFDLLALLVEKEGDGVSRGEIAEKLWGKGVFHDTEQGINTAIRKIRQALGDDIEHPRFVETLVGRGYRFVAPVSVVTEPDPAKARRRLAWWWIASVASAVTLAVAGYLFIRRPADPPVMLAVLPFANLSGDPQQAYFSDGMTEEIITQLGPLYPSGLGVIARTSVMRYKDQPTAVDRIARDLHVDYVLEGSVRREDSRLRITAQLIRTRDQVHLWAQSYERDLTSVLAVVSEIASAIAEEIRLQITAHERARFARTRSVHPVAYDLYLQGREHLKRRTESEVRQAVQCFQKAVDADPTYAPAYAGIADSYATLAYGNYLAPTDGFSKARAAIAKATQLDPLAPEPHASAGYLAMYFDWNFTDAERNLRKALELDPNYASARQWLGILLTAMGRFEDASAELGRAARLDPLSPAVHTDRAFQRHYAGQHELALAALREALALDPRFPLAHFWMGRVLAAQGLCEQALAELDAGEPALREWQPMLAARGYVAARCGQPAAARAILDRFRRMSETRFVTSYGVALVYGGLDQRHETVMWLNKAYDERSHWLVWLKLDPRFAALRPDPRFQDLLRRIGLVR